MPAASVVALPVAVVLVGRVIVNVTDAFATGFPPLVTVEVIETP